MPVRLPGAAAYRSSRGRRRAPLRRRVEISFGLLALGVSLLLSVVAWLVVSNYLLAQRVNTAVSETALDRAALQAEIAQSRPSVNAALEALPTNDASASLALVRGQWYAGVSVPRPSQVPAELRNRVTAGETATQRIDVDGQLVLAVGTPLSRDGDLLFELFPLATLDHTLSSMALVLTICAAVTTVLGVGLGRWASRLALAPLARFTSVVEAVAGGRLDARLGQVGDADLDPIARGFDATLELLEHRARADSRFVADVSHELRTPLTTMLNSMELISHRRDQLPVSVHEAVDLLASDLDRFRQLVVDLLEISRHDAGEDLVLEQVDLGELTRRCADRVAGRPVTHVVEHGHDLVVSVDKRRVERVVANLVGNAEVHGRGCTAVRVTRTADSVRIEVEDAGPGIDTYERTRVFDRFSRGARNRAGQPSPGLGLGLAIVARHVTAHGGQVSIGDKPGGGARFVVELPVR